MGRLKPAIADCPSPVTMTMDDGALTTAVALNVRAGNPLTVAVSVCAPGAVPSVHAPTPAMPCALVTTCGGATLPPPAVTAKVTMVPLTGLLYASVTRTAGAIGTTVPTPDVWLSPALVATPAGGPAVAVAVNVRGVTPATMADAF